MENVGGHLSHAGLAGRAQEFEVHRLQRLLGQFALGYVAEI